MNGHAPGWAVYRKKTGRPRSDQPRNWRVKGFTHGKLTHVIVVAAWTQTEAITKAKAVWNTNELNRVGAARTTLKP